MRRLLTNHVQYTHSTVARDILARWNVNKTKFVKVMPKDYKIILAAIETARRTGIPEEQAIMEAAHG